MRLSVLARTLILGLLLTGCSHDPVAIKPSPLPSLPQAALSAGRDWTASAGGSAGEAVYRLRPARAGGLLFLAGGDGRITAVDENGKTVWQQHTRLPVAGGLSAGYGRLVFGTGEGDVVAMSVTDGVILWKQRLSAAVMAPAALTADRVIAQSQDGRLQVLDAADGHPVWSYDLPVPQLSIRGYAMPVVVGDQVIAAAASGKIVALELSTGAGRWESRVAAPRGRTEVDRLVDIDGDMLVSFDEKLYVGSYQGKLAAFDLRDRPDAIWEYEVSTLQAPAEGLGNIYVVDTTGQVIAVDAATGKAVWRQDGLRGRGVVSPVVTGGVLAVGDADGYVHFLSQADGHVLGRIQASGAVTGLLADGGHLLVSTSKGKTSRWTLPAVPPR